jgi:hypothetical protein
VAKRLDHLDHPGDACGRLGMAEVGLDRTEVKRTVGAFLAIGGKQRLRLDRVAQGGAGAVSFDGVDV